MISPDTNLDDIGRQTFRLVRKGYDPEEVRSYLQRVDRMVAEQMLAAAERRSGAIEPIDDLTAAAVPAADPVDAEPGASEAELVARREEIAELERRRLALQAWFGEDGRADPAAVPGEVTDASARATALVHEAQVQVDQMLRDAETRAAAAGGDDRWADLGEHVARILAQADHEARAIRAAAEVAAADERRAADQDRAASREEREQARQHAAALVDAAAREASDLREQAEPRARAHIAAVLAEGRLQVDEVNAGLAQARTHLEAVHQAVGRTLADAPPPATLGGPDGFVAAADPATGGPADPDADPDPADPDPDLDPDPGPGTGGPDGGPPPGGSGPAPPSPGDGADPPAPAPAAEPPRPVAALDGTDGLVPVHDPEPEPGPVDDAPVGAGAAGPPVPVERAGPGGPTPEPTLAAIDDGERRLAGELGHRVAASGAEGAAGPDPADVGPVVAVAPPPTTGDRPEGVDHELIARIASSSVAGVPAAGVPGAGVLPAEPAGSTARADAAWEAFLSAGADAAADGRLTLDATEANPSGDRVAAAAAHPERTTWASRLRGNRG